MDYVNRIPGIGGLIEITKSKKGVAFIATIIILLAGETYGMERETLLTVTALAVSYLTGQTIVDSRQSVIEIETGLINEVEGAIEGKLEEITTS